VTLTTTTFVSATRLTFTSNSIAVGTHSIKVKNGTVESNSVPLTGTSAPPAITSLDASAFPIYAIIGSGFIDGNTLEITFPDSGKTGIPATWESPTRMTFELFTAQLGTHQVQVVASDGSGNLSNIYDFEVTVLPPVSVPPTLTSLVPSTLVAGSATGVDITVTGTGFTAETQITMTSDGMSGHGTPVYVSATEFLVPAVVTTYDSAGGGMSLAASNPPDYTASNSLPITLTAAAAADTAQAEPPKPRRRGNGTGS
jgi:hypothetical protein